MLRLKKGSKKKKMNFIKKVWVILAPFHKDFYFIFLITVFFETIRMGGPYLFGKILDLLVSSKGIISIDTALFIVFGLAGVRLLSLIIDHITDLVIFKALIKVGRYVSKLTFDKLLQLSLDYHEKVSTGKKISLLDKGTDKLVELIDGFAFEFQPTVLQLIVSAVMIFFTSWRVGLIFSLSLIPFVLITFKINQATSKLREKRHEAHVTASAEIGDAMTNITVVKAFAQEDRENESFGSIQDFIHNISVTEFQKRMMRGFGRNLLIEVFYITLLLVGLFEVRANALTIGGLVFLINLIDRAYSNIYRLGRIYQRVSDAKEPVDSISSLMQKLPSVRESKNPITIEKIDGQIDFKNVSFGYNEKQVLSNLSFTIPAGSFTALVGKSGSGKSTIAKLLSRYYDPTNGQILIDGKYDIKDLQLDSYRSQTAVVFQDSPVPNRRIWEVIAYAAGKKTFSSVSEKVIAAAKMAHSHDFIMELEDGYNTIIGERGVKLSGGQRQRLAIARALFADPKILIMDEPTSHLDTVSESKIQQALEEISRQRSLTKIIIAHRLSTVQKADQILVEDWLKKALTKSC